MIEAKEPVVLLPAVKLSMRRPQLRRILPAVLILQDLILIYLAVAAAYWMRYGLEVGPSTEPGIGFGGYQSLALLLAIVMLGVLFCKGAYQSRLGTDALHDIARVFSAATISVASIVVITYMLHLLAYSRGVLVYLYVLLIVLLALGRVAARTARAVCHRKGWRVRRLLVIGASDTGKMIMQSVRNRPDLGYDIVGFVDRRGELAPDFGRFKRLGSIDDLHRVMEAERVDEIVVALPGSAHAELEPVVRQCEELGVGLKLIPDLFNVSISRVQMDDIAGIPVLNVQDMPTRRLASAAKRVLDLVVGSILLLATLPIIGVLVVWIRLDSDGPAFIRQERLGKGGRPFTCFKLRSMRMDAEQLRSTLLFRNEATGPLFKMRNDPRCTRIGRHLRRFSLDELPQIWNVVRGDMSLVGPRPPLASEVVNYESWQMRRLEVKPGITGLWQVSGRSDLTFDEMVMMDIMYVDNWSPILDFKLLLRTAVAVVAGRGAY